MRPAFFLDRDGVINEDTGYVYRVEDFQFRSGIFDLLRCAQQLRYLLVVVTNQSGIARGYFTEQDFEVITAYMLKKMEQEGVHLAGVYHCPYHKSNHDAYKHHEPDRKPNPGMLLRAQQELAIDLHCSVMLGDKPSDALAAKNVGIPHRYYIQTAYPLDNNAEVIDSYKQMEKILNSLKGEKPCI